jgi:hypothetical protein
LGLFLNIHVMCAGHSDKKHEGNPTRRERAISQREGIDRGGGVGFALAKKLLKETRVKGEVSGGEKKIGERFCFLSCEGDFRFTFCWIRARVAQGNHFALLIGELHCLHPCKYVGVPNGGKKSIWIESGLPRVKSDFFSTANWSSSDFSAFPGALSYCDA